MRGAFLAYMDEHFRAFSFVDRITSLPTRSVIQGEYVVPADVQAFPASLVAEAVGQLAAWAAMAVTEFKRRPVAGLAERIELLAPVTPGQILELGATLDSVDDETVAYHGTAHADGTPVIRLQNCLGPMLALEEFDSPDMLRNRFALLCGPGAAPGAFQGLPRIEFERTPSDTGQRARASLRVPNSAAFFADHFPRHPVFPGSLLMDTNLRLVASLAAEIPTPADSGTWRLGEVLDVKLRTFIPPGATLELEANLSERSNARALVSIVTRNGAKLVGSARAVLSATKCE